MKKSIPLFDEAGEKRTVWEVLADVQREFETPMEEFTEEIDLEEIEKAEFTVEELEEAKNMFVWMMEEDKGAVSICPMNSDRIKIHGAEEMWFFICRLLDYSQKA